MGAAVRLLLWARFLTGPSRGDYLGQYVYGCSDRIRI